jgi:hypothetical protein
MTAMFTPLRCQEPPRGTIRNVNALRYLRSALPHSMTSSNSRTRRMGYARAMRGIHRPKSSVLVDVSEQAAHQTVNPCPLLFRPQCFGIKIEG